MKQRQPAVIINFCLLAISAIGSSALTQSAPVQFIREYSNCAWGCYDNGWFIDSAGAFFTFDLQKDSVWTLSGADSLTPLQMQRMHGMATASNKKISQDTLAQMAALIQSARTGIISRLSPGCVDFGVVSYRAYYYDNAASLYRTIELFGYGDAGFKNSSAAGIALTQWLVYTIDSVPHNAPCLSILNNRHEIPRGSQGTKAIMYDLRGRLVSALGTAGQRLKPGVYYLKIADHWARKVVFQYQH